MKVLDIPIPQLFKDFSELEIGGQQFDFHNDYDCESFTLSKDGNVVLSFISNGKKLQIIFKDAVINHIALDLLEAGEGIRVIDTVYRGRYEDNDGVKEFLDDKRAYYYIDFYSGCKIELFASSVFLVMD